jgi:hypothetical protein
MPANTCPVCSGEIMTYRRFLKKAEPSGIAVCQCCGARLQRSHFTITLLGAMAAGVVAVSALVVVLAARDVFPAFGAIGIIAVLCGAFVLAATRRVWKTVREPALTQRRLRSAH